jgi:catalase
MPLPTDKKRLDISQHLLDAFDSVNGGVHSGSRPAHAKGVMLTGLFRPTSEASRLTRAPHMKSDTPVTVRFSDFAGIPAIADNQAEASPRGCAIRFHLGEHSHTDIVSHSIDDFPASTAEEFGQFLVAVAATNPSQPHPNAIEVFLGAHPHALQFVQAPKPFPTSFAHESFFAVSAFKFTAADGHIEFGRYRIVPVAGSEHLSAEEAAAESPDYLFDEIEQRVSRGPVKFRVVVQLAESGDITNDSTVRWPETRKQVVLGELVLTEIVSSGDAEKRRIIFDPIPRVDGIDPSADPLFEPRADLYLLSGRRRREADQQAATAKAS